MANDVLVLPRYYLTREAADGAPLLLYPVAAIDGAAPERYEGPDRTEDAHTRRGWLFEVTGPMDGAWTFAGAWLVSDREIHSIRRTRPGQQVRDGHMLREEPAALGDEPVSPDLQRAFEDMPEQPTDEALAHYREHEAPHACWPCRVFAASYTARWADGPEIVETQDLGEWLPLPGGEDPDPDREWVVTEPGYLTVYGAHTAHLWPGRLTGLRAAVVAALDAHPLVGSISGPYSHDRHKMSVTVQIPFDEPRTVDRRVKATPRARKATRIITEPVFGVNASVRDVIVPDAVSAPSKAAALDAWQRCVDEQVRRFVPVEATSRVCSHCDGYGITDGTA